MKNEMIKGFAIAVAILLVVAFIVYGLSIITEGIENKTNPKVEETKLIEATIVGVGTEYTTTLKTEILCQDHQKGEYWKAEVGGTPSKGQNVVLEIENDKVVNVWFKQVGGNSHLFLWNAVLAVRGTPNRHIGTPGSVEELEK